MCKLAYDLIHHHCKTSKHLYKENKPKTNINHKINKTSLENPNSKILKIHSKRNIWVHDYVKLKFYLYYKVLLKNPLFANIPFEH